MTTGTVAIAVAALLVASVALVVRAQRAQRARDIAWLEEERREARKERAQEREAERQEKESERRTKQEQAERFSAAVELASLVRKSEDLGFAFDRYRALGRLDPADNVSRKHFVVLAMMLVTRAIALHSDRLREIDVEALTYLGRKMFRGRNASGFEDENKVRSLLWTLDGEPETGITPWTLLKEMDSPDAIVMKGRIIAFAKMVGSFPYEGTSRRSEGLRIFLAWLDSVSQQPLNDAAECIDGSGSDYALFNLQPICNDDELRTAYLAKIKAVHPDYLGHVSDEVRSLATEQVKKYNLAYERLRSGR